MNSPYTFHYDIYYSTRAHGYHVFESCFTKIYIAHAWYELTQLVLFKIVSNFNVYAYALNIPGNKFTHYIIIQ